MPTARIAASSSFARTARQDVCDLIGRMSAVSEALKKFSLKLDHRFGWHRLPVPLGLLVLGEMRDLLRERNLHDTGQPTGMSIPQAGDPEAARYLTGALETVAAFMVVASGTVEAGLAILIAVTLGATVTSVAIVHDAPGAIVPFALLCGMIAFWLHRRRV